MPNWCENEMTITGPGTKDIVAILSHKDSKYLFESLCPIQGYNSENWSYTEYVNNYSVKWDVELQDMPHKSLHKDEVDLIFDTAWNPPFMFCNKLAKKYKVNIVLTFYEAGMDFGGRATFEYSEEEDEISVNEDVTTYHEAKYLYDRDSFWLEMGHQVDNISESTLESALERFSLDYDYVDEHSMKSIKEMVAEFFENKAKEQP
jgi:hypothetical protein